MPHFQITEAKPWHCGQIVRALRAEHRRALLGIAVDVHREIRSRFEMSSYRRAWLIDGQLAGLGGVTGTLAAPTGFVWLALAERALAHPLAAAREARRQLDRVMETKTELATVIVPTDTAAMRLAVFLGFHVADQGLGSTATTRVERIALRRYLDAARELRIPMAGGEVIPVGYHREAA